MSITTVTIDKSYFETLLRRAEFHVSGQDFSTPLDLPIVSIPKVDHDNLLQMAHEYTSLRDALHRGGIAQETLEVLIRGPQNLDESAYVLKAAVDGTPDGQHPNYGVPTTQPRVKEAENRFFDKPYPTTSPASGLNYSHYNSCFDNSCLTSSHSRKAEGVSSYTPKSEDHSDRKNERRTILLQNLPDPVTHSEIVNVVRGGLLLDVYLRSQDRSASVSFVDGLAAQDFMSYMKRNHVYIHGRRLSFEWSERQFYMPGYVASKIRIGATRNLIIRGVKPQITEQRLREDLDHIHNLIIVSVSFVEGNVYLSLNSIHNALFARTCMMSRAMYRGMKIEWYPDECALPLPKIETTARKEMVAALKPDSTPMANRFQMLNMHDDVTEDGSSFGDAEDDTLTTGLSPLKGSLRPR